MLFIQIDTQKRDRQSDKAGCRVACTRLKRKRKKEKKKKKKEKRKKRKRKRKREIKKEKKREIKTKEGRIHGYRSCMRVGKGHIKGH